MKKCHTPTLRSSYCLSTTPNEDFEKQKEKVFNKSKIRPTAEMKNPFNYFMLGNYEKKCETQTINIHQVGKKDRSAS